MSDKSKTFQEGRQFDRRNFLKVPIAAAAVGLLGGSWALAAWHMPQR